MLRVGVSGWSYDSWRGPFYPRGLPRRQELHYASRQFTSLEINGSFYSLLTPSIYRKWHEETPRGFVFALKGSRFITHNKKLKDVETPLANFFASGVLLLKEKLGPILWQLPESFPFDAGKLETFLALLPRDTGGASRLARKHDRRVQGRSWTRADSRRRLRHAIEVRNESFLVPEFARLARRHRAAIVVADSGDWPCLEELTSGFVYLRLHGSPRTYASRYSDAALSRWAKKIQGWTGADGAKRRDVYVYFDNDQRANAPRDALRLASMLDPISKEGGPWTLPS